MTTNGFTYLAVLLFIAGSIVQLDRKYKAFFEYVPGIVVLYFLVMTLSTLGLWQKSDEVNLYYSQLKDNLLQVMIFLMLLRCNVREIFKLGPRMLLGLLSATATICLGFIIVYAAFRSHWEPDTWKTFAALCGSWVGGTGNMVAIQKALDVSDSQMGYTLLMDSVNYAMWVMILLAIVPTAHRFNRWTGADTRQIDEIGARLAAEQKTAGAAMEFHHLILLLGTGFLVSALCKFTAGFLPTWSFLSSATWVVMLATLAGVLGGQTAFGKIPGIPMLANLILYLMVALMGSRANFSELTQAPFYILAGTLIIGIHALSLAFIAKLFRLDLFTCGVASLANIGGVASAPILAAAYSEVLIPIGVLMGMMGYIIGTGVGLLVGQILALI